MHGCILKTNCTSATKKEKNKTYVLACSGHSLVTRTIWTNLGVMNFGGGGGFFYFLFFLKADFPLFWNISFARDVFQNLNKNLLPQASDLALTIWHWELHFSQIMPPKKQNQCHCSGHSSDARLSTWNKSRCYIDFIWKTFFYFSFFLKAHFLFFFEHLLSKQSVPEREAMLTLSPHKQKCLASCTAAHWNCCTYAKHLQTTQSNVIVCTEYYCITVARPSILNKSRGDDVQAGIMKLPCTTVTVLKADPDLEKEVTVEK